MLRPSRERIIQLAAELVDALALGYEVGARAGGWLRINPGLHVDGNWPALGVAAGVARLIGLDARTDLYSVGVLAYELITGQLPYRGATHAEILRQHLNAPIPEPSDLVDIPEEIDGVIKRLLAKAPADRFANAAELIRAGIARCSMRSGGSMPGRFRFSRAPLVTRIVLRARSMW